MKNTYSFLTKNGFRIDVKAASAKSAYNKLMDVPSLAHKITCRYIKYNKYGFSAFNWKSL